jgi:putative nucleotidyltransferase with HDIG domain
MGMFVSKLDRDWLDTPFIMQGFYIEDPEDIEIVAEYCEYVWVDTRQFGKGDDNPHDGTASQRPPLPQPDCPVQEEHKRAYKAFRSARRVTSSLLDEIRLGAAIDSDQAKDVVTDVVSSVIRHPDAMLWLAKVREEHSYTSDHCLNVCVLAVAFGRHLGIEGEELKRLGLCGLLHDVGKMRVPAEIVDKPARLTPKEFSLMKSHTVHGRNLLMTTKNLFPGVVDVAYSHHERIDGKGYPRKLSGGSITPFAKIIAIVDAYDAMTANRCYSRAKTSTEALKEIYKGRGIQFDEEYALEFIKTIGLYPPGSLVELYSGEVGLVFESNSRWRHLPKVLLLLDDKKEHLKKEKVVDLSFIELGDLPKKYLIKQVWPDGSFGLHINKYKERGLTLKF